MEVLEVFGDDACENCVMPCWGVHAHMLTRCVAHCWQPNQMLRTTESSDQNNALVHLSSEQELVWVRDYVFGSNTRK